MKKFTLIAICALSVLASACSNGKNGAHGNGDSANADQAGAKVKITLPDSLTRSYENEFFSISYPAGYEADGDFHGNPANMAELKDMNPEAMLNLPMNTLNIVPEYPNYEWRQPEIYVVLSRHKLEFPLRMFMDLSIHSKQEEDEKNALIGCSEVDSISFGGYPALEVEFAYRGEKGDTLINHQIIVQKPDYSLYYINNNYNHSCPGSEELGNMMISTFKFKN